MQLLSQHQPKFSVLVQLINILEAAELITYNSGSSVIYELVRSRRQKENFTIHFDSAIDYQALL